MADSTKKRKVKEGGTGQEKSYGTATPSKRSYGQTDPESTMRQHPSWSFGACDTDPTIRWAFYKQRMEETFWDTILPKLKEFEAMTLSAIFVDGKKQNHGIDVQTLNKDARKRLEELRVEAEAVHSLRLGGNLRIYGYLEGSVYHILWYDDNHGDNNTCVCRSYKKHT